MRVLPAPDEAIWVGVLRCMVRVPGARSLKDRRHVVHSLRDRVQTRHHASFAEVGHLDATDRVVVAVAVVGNDSRVLQARLDSIFGDMERHAEAVVEDRVLELVPMGELAGRMG
jgi:uncharacterized protein